MDILVFVLLGFILIREFIFHYSMHVLVNKLMSKDFNSYVAGKTIPDQMEQEREAKAKAEAQFIENQDRMIKQNLQTLNQMGL